MLLLSSPVHTAATPTVPGELLSSLTRQQRNWIANGTAPLFQLKRSTLLKEVPVNHLLSTTSSPVTKKVFVSRGELPGVNQVALATLSSGSAVPSHSHSDMFEVFLGVKGTAVFNLSYPASVPTNGANPLFTRTPGLTRGAAKQEEVGNYINRKGSRIYQTIDSSNMQGDDAVTTNVHTQITLGVGDMLIVPPGTLHSVEVPAGTKLNSKEMTSRDCVPCMCERATGYSTDKSNALAAKSDKKHEEHEEGVDDKNKPEPIELPKGPQRIERLSYDPRFQMLVVAIPAR